MRSIFLVGVWTFLAGILVQTFLAGQGMFNGAGFESHAGLGWPLAHLLAPILLILSALCRMGWKMHTFAAVAFVVAATVPVLGAMRADSPGVAALHPLSALVTFALLLYVALQMRPLVGRPLGTASAPTAST